jgi:hypothetical protein
MIKRSTNLRLCLAATILAMSATALAQDPPAIGTKTGEMYPDFVLPTVDGEVRQFAEFRGKRILLFHFASW